MTKTRDTIVFNTYFSGTDQKITHPYSIAGFLYARDIGCPIEDAKADDSAYIKMGKNGCALDHTTLLGKGLGALYGVGIDKHIAEAETKVRELILQGKKVVLNAYGHSRGGITALLLAKKLADIPPDLLEINLALHDPVPGNYIKIAKLDIFNLTLTNQAIDLSACKNIKKVLALYPFIPLRSIEAHAPLFPKYPPNCEVSQDAVPGCHSGAHSIFMRPTGPDDYTCHEEPVNSIWPKTYLFWPRAAVDDSFFSLFQFKDFFIGNGASFNFGELFIQAGVFVDESWVELIKKETEMSGEDWLLIYDHWLKTHCYATKRETHSYQKTIIQSSEPKEENAKYVNLQHKKLYQQCKGRSVIPEDEILLKITPNISHQKVPNNIDYQSQEVKALFENLAGKIFNAASQSSKKDCLSSYIKELQSEQFKFENQSDVINALRNLVALALQRDRHRYSFFTTTHSGEILLQLLNQEQYHIFAKLILGSSDNRLRYRNLRAFVTTKNNSNYFNAKYRQDTYAIHTDHSTIKTDQLNNYRLRRGA